MKGVLYAIRAVTPIMKTQKYGRIVNVASITGKMGDNSTIFVYEEKKKKIADMIPVRRLGTVQDMSYLMMFLASDEASFITGETININGGYYMD